MLRFRVAGRRKPGRLLRRLANLGERIADWLAFEIEVPTRHGPLRFRCGNAQTLRRAFTFHVKEPGTLAWLERNLRPGDTLLDIGANVGTYTLYGALLVGPSGRVVAVEPHLRNAVALMQNIRLNGFACNTTVLAIALAETPRTATFTYDNWDIGSSHSQLGEGADSAPARNDAGVHELKQAQTVDALVECGAIPCPAVVKIDVDGIELPILQGMRRLLASAQAPRSIQVECEPRDAAAIEAELASSGYRIVERHGTKVGTSGADATTASAASVIHNAVFERA